MNDAIGKEMGRRLRVARTAKGWTQSDLADATGFGPSRIGNWEQGTRRIRVEEAEQLEQLLGMPAAYFLTVIERHEAYVLLAMRRSS